VTESRHASTVAQPSFKPMLHRLLRPCWDSTSKSRAITYETEPADLLWPLLQRRKQGAAPPSGDNELAFGGVRLNTQSSAGKRALEQRDSQRGQGKATASHQR